MKALGIRYIQIPVTEDEFGRLESIKPRDQSWRDWAMPKLLGEEAMAES